MTTQRPYLILIWSYKISIVSTSLSLKLRIFTSGRLPVSTSKMIRGEDGSMFLKVGPKGCSSSEVWDDGFGRQVTQIFIWHDKVIHGIQTVYQRDGTTMVGEMHGSDEGNFNAVCLDGPLTRLSGHYDRMIVDIDEMFGNDDYGLKVITALKFETNTSSYGPFGASEIGEAFSYNTETGICGFHGRCSKTTRPRSHRDEDEDLILPQGWIAAFGVYVNVTPTSIVGQGSPGSSTSLC